MKTKRALLPATVTTVFSFLGVLLIQPVRAQTLNPPYIVDPDQPYAGKTYSEWTAAFWRYYTSLPTTNSPFERPAGYPIAPLSTAQSGPVWFLCGNYLPGGNYNFSDTIPGGVALFTAVTVIEKDNTACPDPTNYTEDQLRAFAKASEDKATNMTVTIDGVAVNFLDSALTSPYRVQSPAFDYTCPAVHNVLDDVFGKHCYRTNTGTPYTITGAVEDGVFLMITPLSAGHHTIVGTWAFPPSLNETWTRNLTVLPVALTVSTNGSAGNLVLSWPQTPDTYSVETVTSPDSSQWQPANLTPILSNGVYQAATQMGPDSQFFRLRMN